MRDILYRYETFVALKVFEGREYFYNNTAFYVKISKFSRYGAA